ncbi:MAG TPA: hypothetical protein VK420_01705, partial [Longimicrobium sp.]|nr:hypothetical protein [Longimicrobium sp.]
MRRDLHRVHGSTLRLALAVLLLAGAPEGAALAQRPAAQARNAYYPGPGDDWQRRTPAQAGLDS